MDVLDFPCFQPTLVGFTPCLAVGSAPPGSPRCQSLCQSLIPAKGPGTAGQGPHSALPGAGSPQGWAHLPLPARLPILQVPSTDWGWMHGLGCVLPESPPALHSGGQPSTQLPTLVLGAFLCPQLMPCPGAETPWLEEGRVFAWWDRLAVPGKGLLLLQGQCQPLEALE